MNERGKYALLVSIPTPDPDAAVVLLDRVEGLLSDAFRGDALSFCDGDGELRDGCVVAWVMVPDPWTGCERVVGALAEAGLARGASVAQLVVDQTANGEDYREVLLWPS